MRTNIVQQVYRGRTASIGLARGPFVCIAAVPNRKRRAGALEDERRAIHAALDFAGRQLSSLASAAGGEGGQVLEFQVALLEDEDFLGPIFAAIEAGTPADAAWSSALDEQIAEYNAATDEYLQARSSDLADLRDRVLHTLRGVDEPPQLPGGAVLCAEDLPPSRFLEIDWSSGGGLALLRGSPTSHVALLARARAIPMVVQLGAVAERAQIALLDGERATLELDPGAEQIDVFEKRREGHRKSRAVAHAILRQPAALWGGERVRLLINIQSAEDLGHTDAQFADGVGLMRIEFLLGQRTGLPDEETQYWAYRAVLHWAGKRPVTIRTFDAGGDKPVPGFTESGEANLFLGIRGLRLCLARLDVFTVQLSALARAAVHGNLKVMFPMVTRPEELETARTIFMGVVDGLQAQRVPAALPEIGTMVEVPAAALTIERFNASFFSIGSNDLAQYVTACDRTNGALSKLIDPLQPAVLDLIDRTAQYGKRAGINVSLCGEMAGDPRCIPALLSCGLRELSVNPQALAQVKQAIVGLSRGGARE